jgi:hypothetical protein
MSNGVMKVLTNKKYSSKKERNPCGKFGKEKQLKYV